MVRIKLTDASVEFPVFNAKSRSIKQRVFNAASGGAIDRSRDGQLMVKSLTAVSLEISDGERIGLVGHNGAGKTTLLRVVSGIYQPTSGSVIIQGNCISLINISLGIDPEATGRENIRLRAAMMGVPFDALREKMDSIIEFSGLGDFIDMPFRTYSTGMQLRLAFTVSTSIQPEILIMDEWLSTGDAEFAERADLRLKEILGKTRILVIASHSRGLLESTCDRLIWLEHGRVRMDGNVHDVASAYFG